MKTEDMIQIILLECRQGKKVKVSENNGWVLISIVLSSNVDVDWKIGMIVYDKFKEELKEILKTK